MVAIETKTPSEHLPIIVDTVLSVKGKQAKNQFPPLKQR
jgi:hypothetical protein